MPTYEYRCESCATNFDVVQSFHDDPLTECPTCGSPVRKVFGSVGIVFKGSGFYKTDSRSGSGSKSGGSDSTATIPAKSDTGGSGSGSDSGSGS
ncbi:MAG: FmdB family zinc ribbon protein, partial [Acidimicrobiales bacterium]